MKRYSPKEIEPKWQKIWEETKLYQTSDDDPRPKWYQLEFFPYPSGVTMHVGHVRNYVISDAFARYKRMTGHNVLHPMGWDAFGLPAENQAIKTGLPARKSTEQNIAVFKRQLNQVGLSYDWSREINSSEPDYYRWTQWLFLLFYERKLAYKAESAVNWCPHDKTVLANEQVIKKDGKNVCERCGHEVEKRNLSQWLFKITDYADRLLEDLEKIDWADNVKAMQRNWIGRSVGAEVEFKLKNGPQDELVAFTTRADTLAGATFLVISPELAQTWVEKGWKASAEAQEYITGAVSKSEIERQETDRKKTGVNTGIIAVNPLTKEEIPVWVADYVLGGYGTGAIMAVPAHDQRDNEFAQAFELPIKTVIEPITGTPQKDPVFRRSIVALVEDPETGDVLSIKWNTQHGENYLLVGGGVEEGEDLIEAARREIAEETGYTDVEFIEQMENVHHSYFASAKNIPREIIATGLKFKLKSHDKQPLQLEASEQGRMVAEWLTPKQFSNLVTDELHQRVFERLMFGTIYSGEGIMTSSGTYDGLSSSEARKKITAEVGTERVNYKMRDWLISRQRYWGAPIPIIHCPKCGIVPVPKDQLPVELPELESYHPSDDGRSPLARVKEWLHTECPQCGGPAERETDTMDTFVDSSWYFLRFTDPNNDNAPFDGVKANHWHPVDTYVGGVEHAVAHLLFARFWTKVLHDAGLINFEEPFKRLRNQGMIGGSDGRKMGKRYGNAVTPDDLIDQGYGADALRLYELFIGPYDQGVDWNPTGIDGTKRFLNRVWALTQEHLEARNEGESGDSKLETALAVTVHKAIKKVTFDLEQFGFNTAIAAMMETVNEMYKLKTELPLGSEAWQQNLKLLVQILAPFAPHITEELWQQLGGETSVHVASWPAFDEKLVQDELVTVVVQVNGKVRAKLEVGADAGENQVKELAEKSDSVKAQLEGKEIVKTIYVPGKILNLVVK
ncbi:NUDIX domain-containing protein [Patescibacteria group bacterium]|nr:MAG: NUDIX domain-containing protein [Patescibacteria group bacterium]